MHALDDLHPLCLLIYFVCAMLPAMLSLHPLLLCSSLAGSMALLLMRGNFGRLRTHALYCLLLAMAALINPLFYHDGVTVLLFINSRPFTLEALLYGLAAGGMILCSIYWFRSFSHLMTSDQLLYLMGRLSPHLALITAMALRFVPLFSQQARRIHTAQQGLGLYRDENFPDALRGRVREFSILTTWALENGVTTADSMAARGYGTGRRTSYCIYRFGGHDALYLGATLLLAAPTFIALFTGALSYSYYPALSPLHSTFLGHISLIAYAALCFLPTLMEGGNRIRWRCLRSAI